MQGFFSKSTLLRSTKPKSNFAQCGSCGLYKTCSSPKMKVRGKGRRKILIVLDMPEERDDMYGKPLSGKIGRVVREKFQYHGLDVFEDCWVTYSIICYNGERAPDPKQVNYCEPNLRKTIKQLNPISVFLLGDTAIRSVISEAWNKKVGDKAKAFYGQKIPYQTTNTWLLPIASASWIVANRRLETKANPVVEKLFDRQLESALSVIDERPWDVVPDYKSKVEVCLDPREVRSIIKQQLKRSEFSAFDYETNMLKPDCKKSKLVSNAICYDGERTIAYPMLNGMIKATQAYLRSPSKKIASNLKFEERWSRAFLNTRVRNWYWDTMIAGHVLDRKKGAASVKFQAFVLLGIPIWNKHIEPLLGSEEDDGGYSVNQIDEIDMLDLLIYDGLDAIVEYLVAEKQIQNYNNGYIPS